MPVDRLTDDERDALRQAWLDSYDADDEPAGGSFDGDQEHR